MKTNDLENNLLKLFSNFKSKTEKIWLIEEINDNCLTIRETEKGGENKVTFMNGRFIRLSKKILGEKFEPFFFLNHRIIRRICDGVFLARVGERIILCMVELKNNINNNFETAVRQIEGSYIKTAMLLSLLYNIKDLEIAVFIGGRLDKDDPDIGYMEKDDEFMDKTHSLESKLKEFSLKRKVRMDFPYFLKESIHENYRKKNTNVYHLDDGDSFDMHEGMQSF